MINNIIMEEFCTVILSWTFPNIFRGCLSCQSNRAALAFGRMWWFSFGSRKDKEHSLTPSPEQLPWNYYFLAFCNLNIRFCSCKRTFQECWCRQRLDGKFLAVHIRQCLCTFYSRLLEIQQDNDIWASAFIPVHLFVPYRCEGSPHRS